MFAPLMLMGREFLLSFEVLEHSNRYDLPASFLLSVCCFGHEWKRILPHILLGFYMTPLYEFKGINIK